LCCSFIIPEGMYRFQCKYHSIHFLRALRFELGPQALPR
jgi:hypothetical protein